MKINPDLLQEAWLKNSDAYWIAYAGKINEYNDNMNISMEEEHKTV